jgi:Cu/Zn superoxide dismutase
LKIHEFGDLSAGCRLDGNIGEVYNPYGSPSGESHWDITNRRVGDLEHIKGRIMNNFTADFVSRDPIVMLSGPNSVIGRTIALYEGEDGTHLVELPATAVHPALEQEEPGEPVACCVIGLAKGGKRGKRY